MLRLILEFAFFAFATRALYDLDATTLSGVFGVVVLIHYGLSYDRITWLL